MIPTPVKVYYNNDPDAMFRGYEHGDSLELVFDDAIDLPITNLMNGIVANICHEAFACFNGVYEPDQLTSPLYRRMALRHREGNIRSMSVGDVIVIGENALACARFGWDTVTLKAHF